MTRSLFKPALISLAVVSIAAATPVMTFFGPPSGVIWYAKSAVTALVALSLVFLCALPLINPAFAPQLPLDAARRFRRFSRWLLTIALLIPFLWEGRPLQLVRRTQALFLNTIEVDGEVVTSTDHSSITGGSRQRYWETAYRFTAAGELQMNSARTWARYEAGTPIKIRYVPSNPLANVISDNDAGWFFYGNGFFLPIILLGLMDIVLISVGLYWRRVKSQEN